MDISLYLSELLQSRKTVGIPGLGTIYKKKSPGRYDAAAHSFVPPSYTLSFEEEVIEDNALSSFISKKRNVSEDTAVYFINEYVSNLQKELSDNQEANLGDIGNLKKSDGHIVLNLTGSINYGFDFYGLPTVKSADTPLVETVTENSPQQQNVEREADVIEDVGTAEDLYVLEEADAPEETEAYEEEIHIDVVPEEPVAHEETEPSKDEVNIEVVPEEEAPQPEALEEIIKENEISEENPGDVIIPQVEALADETVIENTIQPSAETKKEEQQKDTEQLRAQIEALNFYRSKSPSTPYQTNKDNEVIWQLKESEASKEKPIEPEKVTRVYLEEEEPKKATNIYIHILKIAAVLVVLAAAAFMLMPSLFNGINDRATKTDTAGQQVKTTALPAVTDSTLVQDTATVKTDTTQASKTPVSPAPATTTVPAVTAPVTQAAVADSVLSYEIIGASVINQKEADHFIYLMKRSGIKAKVVTNIPGKRLKMSIATLKDEASAKLERDRLQKKLKIEGIYIYRNKQK